MTWDNPFKKAKTKEERAANARAAGNYLMQQSGIYKPTRPHAATGFGEGLAAGSMLGKAVKERKAEKSKQAKAKKKEKTTQLRELATGRARGTGTGVS
jgi:hypothetical protein